MEATQNVSALACDGKLNSQGMLSAGFGIAVDGNWAQVALLGLLVIVMLQL